MLLMSPHTRKAHVVVLLIPTAALAALLLQERLMGAARKLAWAALVFLGAATLLTAEGVIGVRAAEVAHAAGASTWAMVFLYVAAACALRQITRRVDFRFSILDCRLASGAPFGP
jgi:TRAP-type mannitol/chloroaromatic compound transport system permease large subunit